MRLFSFPAGRQTSLLSYQPWIISTNISLQLQLTINTPSQSKLPLQLAKKLSTGTTTKPIILRCSELQWVGISHSFYSISLAYPCLVLHPRHKLRYFKNAKWQDDWIDRAEDIVRSQFDLSYRSLDTSWATPQETQLAKAHVSTFDFLL